jgi:hypothetical protein
MTLEWAFAEIIPVSTKEVDLIGKALARNRLPDKGFAGKMSRSEVNSA